MIIFSIVCNQRWSKTSHPLASVNGVFNAVYVYGEAVGETMFYGPGAGELPTATSIVADLVAVVKNLKLGVNGQMLLLLIKRRSLRRMSRLPRKISFCFMWKIKPVFLRKLHKYSPNMK